MSRQSLKASMGAAVPIHASNRRWLTSVVPPFFNIQSASELPPQSATPASTSRLRMPPWQSLLRFLGRVDRVPQTAAGQLVFAKDGVQSGRVCIDQGRICWASAAGMAGRLTTLISELHEPPLASARLEAVYEECRARNQTLSEQLVRSGVVSESGLRSVLLQHSTEAIARICQFQTTATWVPYIRPTYEARHTYSTLDVLLALGSLARPDVVSHAEVTLAALAGQVQCCASFTDVAPMRMPLAAIGLGSFGIAGVLSMARWLHSVVPISDEPEAAGNRFASCEWSDGTASIAWGSARCSFVALCADRSHKARVLGIAARG